MSPVETGPHDVTMLVRLFGHIGRQFTTVWEAVLDDRLSRAVAPNTEIEDALIAIVSDLCRAIGEAIRTGAKEVVIRPSLPAAEMKATAERCLRLVELQAAFVDTGLDLALDPELDDELTSILEELLAAAEQHLETQAAEGGRASE